MDGQIRKLEEGDGTVADSHIVPGKKPAREIIKFTREPDIGMMVIGSRGLGRFQYTPLEAASSPQWCARLLPGARGTRGCERGRSVRTVEEDGNWRGSPLDMGSGLDHYGIEEVVIEFGNGDEDVFRPKLRDEFASYELHEMAAYLDSVAHSIRKGQKR